MVPAIDSKFYHIKTGAIICKCCVVGLCHYLRIIHKRATPKCSKYKDIHLVRCGYMHDVLSPLQVKVKQLHFGHSYGLSRFSVVTV